jgi:hypothetical protein
MELKRIPRKNILQVQLACILEGGVVMAITTPQWVCADAKE